MTESKLNLGNELFNKLSKLKKEREKYFNVFEHLAEQKNQNSVRIKIKKSAGHIYNFKSYFPVQELLKLYEFRIKTLDIEIEDIENKFKQL